MKNLKQWVEWIEIPVTDMPRARQFYEALLDIQLQEVALGDDLVMAFFPVEPGAVGGALCRQPDHYTPDERGVVIYLSADPDIETLLQRATAGGGTILMPRKLISPQAGWMAMFRDSEGNRIALYEKAGRAS